MDMLFFSTGTGCGGRLILLGLNFLSVLVSVPRIYCKDTRRGGSTGFFSGALGSLFKVDVRLVPKTRFLLAWKVIGCAFTRLDEFSLLSSSRGGIFD